jgi:hypothetical protein
VSCGTGCAVFRSQGNLIQSVTFGTGSFDPMQ